MQYTYIKQACLIFLITLSICFLSSCTSLDKPPEVIAAPEIGYVAPDFSLRTSNGILINLHDLKGNPVFINFWATWCGPCVSEMPDIQTLYKKYKKFGLVIIGINQQESTSDVTIFASDYGITFPLLIDSSGKVNEAYRVNAIPKSFFIDREGVIREIYIGSMSKTEIEIFILEILK